MTNWLFLLLSLLQSWASPVDQTKPFFSQKAYEFWSNQKCQDISLTDLTKLESITQCQRPSLKKTAKVKIDLGEITENIFFNYAANKQVDILNCQISKLNQLTDNSKEARAFHNLIQQDVSSKLPDLRNLYRKINEIQDRQGVLDTRLSRPDFLSSDEIKALINEKTQNNKQLAELTPKYGAIYNSIWNSSDPNMRDYLDKIISSNMSLVDFEKKYSFNKEVLQKIKSEAQSDLHTLNKQYNAKAKTYDLNQETKELIVKKGDVITHLHELDQDPKNLEKLYCRLEARYGQGTDYLENTITAGSLLIGGVGIVTELAAIGKLSRLGISLAAKNSQIAMSTAQVLLASSTALGTLNTIEVIDRCSPQSVGALSSFRTDNCSSTAAQLVNFEAQRQEQTNCVLETALAATPLAMNYGFKLGHKAYGYAERRFKESAVRKILNTDRTLIRNQFVSHYLEKTYTSEVENLRWVNLAEASSNGTLKNAHFFDVENSVLKMLNDTTKDKNLITSLTNKNKEILFNKIETLKKNNPGLEVSGYSDFKSSRFAFTGKLPADLEMQVKKMFSEANSEYTEFLKSQHLIRESDVAENWFRAGFGRTADEATLAARYSRKTKGINEMQNFSNPEVLENLKSARLEAESLRKSIQDDFGSAEFMEKVDGTNSKILNNAAFDIVRKSSTPEGAAEALQKIYGVKVSAEQAQKMKSYISRIDEFSPGIHISKREFANLSEAEKGGISADFAGMGASNLAGTAKALAKSDELQQVIFTARQEEKKVTSEFLSKKRNFESSVNNYLVDKKKMQGTSITCSGDDCVVVSAKSLDTQTKLELVKRLSKNENPASLRVAFIGDNITDAEVRNTLASHGETIEKILRKNLEGAIPHETLSKVLFSVDVQASELGRGQMKLLMGNSRIKLSNDQTRTIQSAFDKSVQDFNEVLKKNESVGSYLSAGP